jgi:succinate-semialdehyde dehydrogenase/glutarate-semialdehyde dehydrogenase
VAQLLAARLALRRPVADSKYHGFVNAGIVIELKAHGQLSVGFFLMKIINPATEKVVGDYPPDTPEVIDGKLRAAADAFEGWRARSMEDRCTRLRRLAALLRQKHSDLALIAAREMGKPLSAGETEVNKCAVTCEHFAQHAAGLLEPQNLATSGGRGYARFDALGPVLGIMPWNFPYWQVIRFAAAAITAGNTIILKHAPSVPECATALENAFRDSGYPEGTFVSVRIDDNATAQKLCSDPRIAAVSFTGSGRAGALVAASAGASIKKSVLELGGSDAFIVLKDADIEFTAASAAEARCMNTGQSCIAAKRFLIDASIFEKFRDAMAAAMKKRKIGDPMDRNIDLGPLARLDLLENLQRQVDQSLAAGAKLIFGGKRSSPIGFFYPPTMLTDCGPGMPVFDEETFGPVAALRSVADSEEMIHLANQNQFGLGASIWTHDLQNGEKMAARLDVGSVYINSIVRSDPRMPFGGIKKSGWGRELAEQGLKEFTNTKTVWVGKP